jgi:hypothetical protein
VTEMRVPTSKIYRAFSALDPFTDEQCAGYVRRAKAKHMASRFAMAIAVVPTVILVAVGGIIGVELVVAFALRTGLRAWSSSGNAEFLLQLLGCCIAAAIALVVGLVMRDAWLRWAIGIELRRSTCPGCEYQLLGLKAVAGCVRCPECGMDSRVDLLRLANEDLEMVRMQTGDGAHPPLAS